MKIGINSVAYPFPFLMVDELDHLTGLTGLTPTITLRLPDGSVFVAAGGTVAEVGNGIYQYTPLLAEVDAPGVLLVHATAAGADPAYFQVDVGGNDPYLVASGITQQQVRDAMLLAPGGGAIGAGSVDKHLDDIQARTDLITTGAIKVGAVVNSTTATLEIVQGDAYLDSIGGAITITADSNNRLPSDITGSTVKLKIKRRSDSAALTAIAGTIVTPTGTSKVYRFDIPAATTAGLTVGENTYQADVAVQVAGVDAQEVTTAIFKVNVLEQAY